MRWGDECTQNISWGTALSGDIDIDERKISKGN
jgi:hypothetical protein